MGMTSAKFEVARWRFARLLEGPSLRFLIGLAVGSTISLQGAQVDIFGPPGSVGFGHQVFLLPNGNIVVTDPSYNDPVTQAESVGAVHLYDGITLTRISSLTGSSSYDSVGLAVTILSDGNFVVQSPYWANGAAVNAGAVTWGSQTTGVSGVVSATNSLVGTSGNDRVGLDGVVALGNGHYVVRSLNWSDGAKAHVGAVTWGEGRSGVTGAVSAGNSLIGGTAGDFVGSLGVTVLPSGDYVVRSGAWANGGQVSAGAVTWCSGATGRSGIVSPANSLVGNSAYAPVGSDGIVVLRNGSYVVRSTFWNGSRGAVTWGSGTAGVAGVVSSANSLVGATSGDSVGSGGVVALANGNYVVSSDVWDRGTVVNAGAVTWGSGTSGVSGVVSTANSLVGSQTQDRVGNGGVQPLVNGHYVVQSRNWANGAIVGAGAVTWGSGTSGVVGSVSSANSLVGGRADDQVGFGGVVALANGHYVVISPYWNNGTIASAGAVTWGDGSLGIKGLVSSANSLVGSRTADMVGSGGVVALPNGHYVVRSPEWDNGTLLGVGAVSWGNGYVGIRGVVSQANSMTGGSIGDRVGSGGVVALSNGSFVVQSPQWKNGGASLAGAATWGDGSIILTGMVSVANSLVGTAERDMVGISVTVLTGGDYVVRSPSWNGYGGAVTWGSAQSGARGAVSFGNSVWGSTPEQVGNQVQALRDGSYAILSPGWNENRGAIRICRGTDVSIGSFTEFDSLVGSTPFDAIGSRPLADFGSYVVATHPDWSRVGAATMLPVQPGLVGRVFSGNSFVGDVVDGGNAMAAAFDAANARLIVGYRLGSRFSVFAQPVPLRGRLADPQLRFADPYKLSVNAFSTAAEFAVYARTDGRFAPELTLLDFDTGGPLATNSTPVPLGDGAEAVLLFTNGLGRCYEAQVRSANPVLSGAYEVGFYPIVRPGTAVQSSLNLSSVSVTNRAGTTADDWWRVEDYVVQGFSEGELLDVSVESESFDPYVKILDLRTEEVLAGNDNGWGSSAAGTTARLVYRVNAGQLLIVRATSREPAQGGRYTVRARAVLPVGYRVGGHLGGIDEVSPSGAFVDGFTLASRDTAAGAELAAYARSLGEFAPGLRIYDLASGMAVGSSNLVAATGDQLLVTFAHQSSVGIGLEVVGPEDGSTGDYEAAVFPVVRPGEAVMGALTEADPVTTNRTAAVGAGRWLYDDYLLRGVAAGEKLVVRLEQAGFEPFLEMQLVGHTIGGGEWPNYTEGAVHYAPALPGIGGVPRDVIIRVTSRSSGAGGPYRMRVDRLSALAVWSFAPEAGVAGTWVTVRGTNFLNGLNPAVTGVRFGQVLAALTEPVDRGAWQEFEALVPEGAVTGPIVVDGETGSAASTNNFVVLAPVMQARLDAAGLFSFGVSNSVIGGRNVVEAAMDLNPPVRWQPTATNLVVTPGVWRYTNTVSGDISQQFFRIRKVP